MSALFVRPLPFVAASTSPAATAPISNAANDLPGMVWRAPLASSYFIIDLGSGTLAYDTIALIGTNLRATDTVQIRTGATTSGTGGYAGAAAPAWTGTKPDLSTADAIFKLGSTRTERYVRVDLVATGHPDGFVQAIRVVAGKAVVTMGIAYDAELGFEDGSVINSGPGYRSIDEYPVLTSWKISTGWITDQSWRGEWFPMLQWAGSRRGILFIPDDSTPANWQTDALFGCITSRAAGKAENYNSWRFEGTIASIAP